MLQYASWIGTIFKSRSERAKVIQGSYGKKKMDLMVQYNFQTLEMVPNKIYGIFMVLNGIFLFICIDHGYQKHFHPLSIHIHHLEAKILPLEVLFGCRVLFLTGHYQAACL